MNLIDPAALEHKALLTGVPVAELRRLTIARSRKASRGGARRSEGGGTPLGLAQALTAAAGGSRRSRGMPLGLAQALADASRCN